MTILEREREREREEKSREEEEEIVREGFDSHKMLVIKHWS